ncbi:IS3 family transposase [Kitasatospora purpeofusca]|uniref:IS3 family transposase n=1 Tax=Kitasatospora purpeofusca TaxID=67352 RepID=UPI002E14FD5F|nr:IS3 family transposase [Kitasatospora purpeofusca]WSR44721.1 IS3 family transposase [Kitasatospora purpeofusca]
MHGKSENRDDYQHVPRPLAAMARDLPDGHHIPPHHHRRAQLIYGTSGAITVVTDRGTWVVPTTRGVWVPAGVVHAMTCTGPVRMRTLYIEPGAAPGLPDTPTVVAVPPLLRELVDAATRIPLDYRVDGRDGRLVDLLLLELRAAPGRDHGGVRADQGDEEGDRRTQARQRDPQGGGEFLRGRARPAAPALVAFVDEHRGRFGGVEPICRVLTEHGCSIAPSTYCAHRKRLAPPSARTVRDEELKELIKEVYDANYRVYGARKVWREPGRQGRSVARCTVERLMRELGISGAVRGKKVITTIADPTAERAPDLVDRQFVANAQNRCRVADFTHIATWAGVVCVAFVVDTFSRRIVGWSAATSKGTRLVLDALEMALWQRDRDGFPYQRGELIHHSDAGSQYTSFRLAEHLDAAGIAASIGSVGDAYDNALMESAIGLYKTELIKPGRPWKTLSQIELATAEWTDRYCHRRLHGEIGHVPPAEYETAYHLTTTKTQVKATT